MGSKGTGVKKNIKRKNSVQKNKWQNVHISLNLAKVGWSSYWHTMCKNCQVTVMSEKKTMNVSAMYLWGDMELIKERKNETRNRFP